MPSRLTSHLQWVSHDTTQRPEAALLHARVSAETVSKSTVTEVPLHDPPLAVREEVVYLLHIASEVEHALMVQYLYAVFSLGGPMGATDKAEQVKRWRESIATVAREEMGHLATVQNILQLIGGPITFDREDFPIPSDMYPFPFTLEPLTLASLGKYVLAERPSDEDLEKAGLLKEIQAIEKTVHWTTTGHVNRVGALYTQVLNLLDNMAADDFEPDSFRYQARSAEWGLGQQDLLIETATSRKAAKTAIALIAEQGEGATLDPTQPQAGPSHFMRFLHIYRELSKVDWAPAQPVPINPTTKQNGVRNPMDAERCWPDADPARSQSEAERATANSEGQTPILHPVSRRWAQLSNVRYHMLLRYLTHSFRTESVLDAVSRNTPRGLLVSWAFGEMYNLRSLGAILAALPLDETGDETCRAGLPFEMPYSLALPDREQDRWRVHRDAIATSAFLIGCLLEKATGREREYLIGLQHLDQTALNSIIPIIAG
ncbi:MAG: uncharacterized protein JWN14_4512 [Chthonomonadales bacterium]|nr:uncharacterized protein [Chthonomonadales bacterium]